MCCEECEAAKLKFVAAGVVKVEVGADPGDGLLEAGADVDPGGPAEAFTGFAVVGEEAHDLGLFGAEALGAHCYTVRKAGQGDDLLGEVADGDLGAEAQVKCFTNYAFGFGGFDKTGDGVGDKGEVAFGVEVAQMDDIAGEGLGDDGGDDGAGGLSGAVGVEGADGDGLDIEGAPEALDELVGADLAGGVGRLPLQGMLLADGNGEGGAVDLAGGGMDQLAADLAAGLEDVEGADDVGLDDLDGVVVGVGDGDERTEVEDEILACGGTFDGIGIAQVASDQRCL